MKPNLSKCALYALIALAIGCAAVLAAPSLSQAAPSTYLYINSSGQQIPTIFWGLHPDAKFARALGPELALLQQKGSAPHFQSLVYREGCPRKTSLAAAHTAAQPQVCPCFGQYMIQEARPCGGGGCGGGSYWFFYSGGGDDCHGYGYVDTTCNDCQDREDPCDPCIACS